MKQLTGLTEEERKTIVTVLEMVTPETRTTIKDIRTIDKICQIVESTEGAEISLEDADYEYMKNRIKGFSGWMPKSRKDVIALADKLGL